MEKVERTQYQALAITGTWQGTNCSKLYEELGWETLSDRRWCRRILHVHKIEKYKTTSYLRDKLPPRRRPLYRFNNSNTFQEIRCKTSRYKNSFFPDTTSTWNNIISNFQDIPTIAGLKVTSSFFNSYKDQNPFWYSWCIRTSLSFSIEGKSSPLRSHKRRHNFSDTPFESCRV